ncbi:hypothetical protein V6N13_074245 [Hibiscus sabdariffa]
MAIFGGRGTFWREKKGALLEYPVQVRHETEPAQVRTDPAQTDFIAGVLGVTQLAFLDLLGQCVIGWCQLPIPIRVLAAEMRTEGINDASVMRISGNRVLIIFNSIEERDRIVSSGDTFERLAAIGESVICVEEETLDPTSFERGRILIESPSLTRVEFKVDLKVLDAVFPVRVSEAELCLRGPRVSRVVQGNRSDGSNSDSEDMMANSVGNDVGNGSGRDRTLWDTVGEGVESDAQVNKTEVVSALPGSDGLNLELGWPVVPYKEEVLANTKRKGKGCGRPRNEGEVSVRRIASNSASVITDISLTDSDVNCRQSAILREAKATVGLGKLIGATTIGNEEVIIQDIDRLLLPSS